MRRVLLAIALVLSITATSFTPVPPARAATCRPFAVGGLIGARWQQLGGGDGPLGCPTSEEQDNPGGHGRFQAFDHGQVVWSPDQGGSFVLAAYQQGYRLVADWGDTAPFNYDYFNVRWDKDGVNVGQRTLHSGEPDIGRTAGRWAIDNPALGVYRVVVEGCDDGGVLTPSTCRQGFSQPAFVNYGAPDLGGPCLDDSVAGGLIGARWTSLGGRGGPLGCALSPEQPLAQGNGRMQQFQHGQVVWSPDQGSAFVVAGYQQADQLVVDWGDTAPFNYDYFNVRWDKDGANVGQQTLHAGEPRIGRTAGRWAIPNPTGGTYRLVVEGCDDGGIGTTSTCRQGFSQPIYVTFGAITVPIPDPNGPCLGDEAVGGLIGGRWASIGSRGGPLGCATSPELFPLEGIDGRYQQFQHGQIAWSPAQGGQFTLAAYPQHTGITVIWGDTASFNYDYFNVRWDKDGVNVGQRTLHAGELGISRTGGRWSIPVDVGTYRIVVEGCDDGGIATPSTCRQGFSNPVSAIYSSAFTIDVLPATNVAEAKASLQQRRAAIVDYEACHGKLLGELYKDENDFGVVAIAKLERGGTCPDEAQDNIGEVNDALLRSQVRSNVGTSFDGVVDLPIVGGVCTREGEYDVALRGLVTIMYRYRDKLRPEIADHVLHGLLNQHGPHDPGIESITICGVSLPETENHILMIESSRYLTNQLLFHESGAPEYDNEANGMNLWMLRHLRQFLTNDFAEYNARPYQHYTLAALQNLYDFAEDGRVKLAAQMVLDYASAKFAVSSNELRRVAPFRRRKEFKDDTFLAGMHSDPEMSRFMFYSGLMQRLGEVQPPNHAHWYAADDILLPAIGSYQVPDAILDLTMDKAKAPYYQRIYHGVRPNGVPGGVEIYDSEAPFLISGGGIWMESGHGSDEINKYSDTGWALPTTLMPTAEGLDRANFIRINGSTEDHQRVNTCVAPGFACGLNPVIPAAYPASCTHTQGNWTFVDASGACPGGRNDGFYVAVYQAPCSTFDCSLAATNSILTLGGTFGFFEAVSSAGLAFDAFEAGVLARNGATTYQSEGVNTYVTTAGHTVQFTPNVRGNKYQWGISALDGVPQDTDITHWPLAAGGVMNSDGHSGFVTVDHPAMHERLILDMRDPTRPSRAMVALSTQQATISPASGGSLVAADGQVRVDLPPAAVANDTTVTFTDLHVPTQPLPLGSMALRSFSLEAQANDGHSITQFQQPYTITVVYTDQDLAPPSAGTAEVTLAFWNAQGGRWEPVPTTVETRTHQLVARLDHMTTFAVLRNVRLDNFNRPDGNLGGSWAGRTSQAAYRVRVQRIQVRAGGLLYWRTQGFEANQQAYVTLATIDQRNSRESLVLKVQGDRPNVRFGAIEVRYYAKIRRVRVLSRVPGQDWQLVADLNATFNDGDQLGAQAAADGTVQVYRNGSMIGTAQAGSFFANKGGRVGLRSLDARETRLDDFGGGALLP